MAKTRNITFDLMKGITILLMMFTHLLYPNDGVVSSFVYSFHMPLFFLLAGMFAKDIEDIPSFAQFTKKNAMRLLLPFAVTMLLRCAWGGVQSVLKHDIAYFMQPLLCLAVASPDGWETQWGYVYAGPMWFLVSLFWVRELFFGMQYALRKVEGKYRDILFMVISLVLSVLSVYVVFPAMRPFPFGIIQAFTALPFYAVGWYVHKHNVPIWVYMICLISWPFAIKFCHVTLAYCTLWYYPLAFIGACGGTYAIYLLCKGLDTLRSYIINHTPRIKHHILPITSSLIWCGVYSLPILCMHELEMYSAFLYSIICRFPIAKVLVGWGEMGIAIVMAIIVLNVPYLKKVYR